VEGLGKDWNKNGRLDADEQWESIRKLGRQVDGELQSLDVRLTMGGEPTFVSIDDMDGAEWSTEAIGPTKRIRAADLAERLRTRFAPGGLPHFGQGKWYPGEPLPRWAFSVYWRADGEPLWRDASLVADEARPHGSDAAEAERYAETLAGLLEIDPGFVVPAYEDPLAVLQHESALPDNLDPASVDLDDAQERAQLARILSRGVTQPAAFVLPVQAWNARDGRRRWRSEKWSVRRDRLYLAPGDSPAGYRLPLDALPDLLSIEYPHVFGADPTWPRGPLAVPTVRS